ncbi:MAG: NeuD/PglB/VioB family sugar acetyltransferase [Phycisphaerales bacterium]|nr:MAG: NeuD/PglB/VioB family sugar acetyltransferase [Phycisphaerales bacterium]
MPEPTEIALVGGGGHALVVAHLARRARLRVTGVYDDDPDCVAVRLDCLPHLGPLEAATRAQTPFIIVLGDLAARRRAITALPAANFARLAPAECDPTVTFAPGAIAAIGAIIQPHARIGAHAIINTGAIVEHECEIAENAHIAPGAILAGRVRIGRDTLVGIGSRVLPGVRIGAGCVVGAGAVVTADVADGVRVAGVPAKPIA